MRRADQRAIVYHIQCINLPSLLSMSVHLRRIHYRVAQGKCLITVLMIDRKSARRMYMLPLIRESFASPRVFVAKEITKLAVFKVHALPTLS